MEQLSTLITSPEPPVLHISYREALFDVLRQNRLNNSGNDLPLVSLETPSVSSFSDSNGNVHILTSTAMHSKDYTDGPGELDMLIGFFLMNIGCIGFFLGFGMCVICSCVSGRPKPFNQKMIDSKALLPAKLSKSCSPPSFQSRFVQASAVKSSFKSIGSRIIADKKYKQLAVEGPPRKPSTKIEVNGSRKCSTALQETNQLLVDNNVKNTLLKPIIEPRRNGSCRSVQVSKNAKFVGKTFSMPNMPALCHNCHPSECV